LNFISKLANVLERKVVRIGQIGHLQDLEIGLGFVAVVLFENLVTAGLGNVLVTNVGLFFC
jgi:hypothetical protein